MNMGYICSGFIPHAAHSLRNMLPPDPTLNINKKLRHKHDDQTCFILGSGPSIQNQDLTKLAGQITMTQNHFHSHNDIQVINPSYHVVVPKYQPAQYDTDWHTWFESMEKRLPQSTDLFVGLNTKYILDSFPNLKKRAYFIRTGINPLYINRAVVDITRNIMNVLTALTECITIALYMNFKTIYLTGFDLNQVCIIQKDRDNIRFYGNSPITKNDSEKQAEEALGRSGGDWYNMWLIWRQLNLLREYASQRDISIINLTAGGLLNVYPRQDYNEVVKSLN